MSPDFPLKIVEWLFQFGAVGFLLGMLGIYAALRAWYFYKLLSGDAEKHAKVFQEARGLIESEHWGTRYRMFLKKVLGKLTKVIGDENRFPNEEPQKIRIKAGDSTLEKAHKQSGLQKVFGINPFTAQSYEFCMLLALLYPVFSFLMGWVVGGSGTLGSLEVFPEEPELLKRLMIFFGLLTTLGLIIWSRQLSGWKSIVAFAVAFAGAGAGAFAGAFAGAGAVAFAGAVAVAFAGAVAVAVAFAFAGAVAGAGAGAFAGAFAGAVAVVSIFVIEWIYNKAKFNNRLLLFWLCFSCIYLPLSFLTLEYTENATSAVLLVFYLILPLVNAPLDWLSLGVTRGLLQSIRFKHHKFGKAMVWSCIDLALAVIALLLVSGVTVAVISLANKVSPTPIIDLQALFISLSSLENWRDNLWIYFMLLSTLVPTSIHFALAGGALTLAVSDKKRKEILADMETNDLSAKRAWAYISVMPAFGFVLAPAILIYSLYWLLHAHGDFLGGLLLAWAKMLATLIDPNLGQVVI